MVDNRYATALVIGSVLSLLATVYLSVAVGTQHWYQYRGYPPDPQPHNSAANTSDLVKEFLHGDFDEKSYSDTMLRLNGTLGLWWRCIMVPYPKMASRCVSFTLPQQFASKYKQPGNESSGEDLLRTYMWRCQFLLPLVALALVFLSSLVGVCACLCRSVTPTLGVGVLHLLAGLCSLGTVCCFLAGLDLLHRDPAVDGAFGWSLYLALISSPLQMMAAALFLWAARSHRKSYTRMTAYRVA
ncbi:hypothetical protein NHX12_018864 [Muraenolepis orangiensis]|uniref:Claudin domain containing 1 n=1 Tax=Muraenolepis orangiensis TaxID=630683 RepID=A0A9Q0IZ34_9TELE|nr:hypothetical protein NHX12_018864 [Muraenolepis orangiensis]